MKIISLFVLLTASVTLPFAATDDASTQKTGRPESVGNIIQRQVFTGEPNERYILTQTRDVTPTGNQSCTNRNCNTRTNTWEMVTADPLYFLASSIKIVCKEKIRRHCELYGSHQITNTTDRSITFTTADRSPETLAGYGGPNTYTVSANLMIKEPRTKKGVLDPQEIYSGIKFYISIPDSAAETELIGYHKKHGPFLIDPLNFETGYGIKKIGLETYPGGKRLTFLVEDE